MINSLLLLGLVLIVLPYAIQTGKDLEQLSTPVIPPDTFTAGGTMCRNDTHCGYHGGTNYSWCYVDYDNKWDYCCTTPCFWAGKPYMWCSSGSQKEYFCGSNLPKDIHGRDCLTSHRCGLHHEEDDNKNKSTIFWCYVDRKGSWGKCCRPYDKCSNKGEERAWCYTGIMPNSSKAYCTPLE